MVESGRRMVESGRRVVESSRKWYKSGTRGVGERYIGVVGEW